MLVAASHAVEGHVARGFEAVRDAFADNFARRGELGGACCAYHRGEKVVDLWGGIRNKQTGEPWEQNTMVIVYSATKGLAAMTLAIAHSRGWLDYEERVCAVLAGVRAAGQGEDHRPPTPCAPGRLVCARPAHRSESRRRPRSACGGAGAAETGLGAWDAAGLSRHHTWLLRERDPAPHRSATSEPWRVLPGRDRDASGAGRLYPVAGFDPELPPGHHRSARIDRDATWFRPAIHAGSSEPPLQYLPRTEGLRVATR